VMMGRRTRILRRGASIDEWGGEGTSGTCQPSSLTMSMRQRRCMWLWLKALRTRSNRPPARTSFTRPLGRPRPSAARPARVGEAEPADETMSVRRAAKPPRHPAILPGTCGRTLETAHLSAQCARRLFRTTVRSRRTFGRTPVTNHSAAQRALRHFRHQAIWQSTRGCIPETAPTCARLAASPFRPQATSRSMFERTRATAPTSARCAARRFQRPVTSLYICGHTNDPFEAACRRSVRPSIGFHC